MADRRSLAASGPPSAHADRSRLAAPALVAALALALLLAAAQIAALLKGAGTSGFPSPVAGLATGCFLLIAFAACAGLAFWRGRERQLADLTAGLETEVRAREAAEVANLAKNRY